MKSLPKLSFILCGCKNAGNMGAVARAIKNMGSERLILVRPNREKWLDGMKMAPGAEDILENAIVYDSIEEAVMQMHLVIGTTRRIRKNRLFSVTPREIFSQLLSLPSKTNIAVLFGSERNGLTNHELSLCQKIVHIPTSASLPSINLAQAVMILAYEWFMACCTKGSVKTGVNRAGADIIYALELNKIAPDQLADWDQRHRLIRHMNQVLRRIGFVEKHSEHNIMLTLIDILSRLTVTEREVAILRGILSKIEYCLNTEASINDKGDVTREGKVKRE